MARKRKPTTDADEILHRHFFEGKPHMMEMLEEELANCEVAQMIYDLRVEAKLSQRQLAKKVGTTASVICRLEDAYYEGHSLAMLRRVAAAVKKHVEIKFVPIKTNKRRMA